MMRLRGIDNFLMKPAMWVSTLSHIISESCGVRKLFWSRSPVLGGWKFQSGLAVSAG
jgi:hypothetical protein